MNKQRQLYCQLRSPRLGRALGAIEDTLRRYGDCNDEIRLGRTPFLDNHRIGGFFNGLDGVYAFLEWKTDYGVGERWVSVRELYRQIGSRGTAIVDIPDGEKATITRKELLGAMRCLADYIAPEKAFHLGQSRLALSVRNDLFRKVTDSLFDVWQGYANETSKRRLQCYHNGKTAVMAFVAGDQDRYMAMPGDEFREIVLSVFRRNEKTDRLIRKDEDGMPVYDIKL